MKYTYFNSIFAPLEVSRSVILHSGRAQKEPSVFRHQSAAAAKLIYSLKWSPFPPCPISLLFYVVMALLFLLELCPGAKKMKLRHFQRDL